MNCNDILCGSHSSYSKATPAKKVSSSKLRQALDSDEGELLSGWEEDSPRYLMSLPDVVANPSILLFSTVANNKALSDADAVASDEDIIYMEDLATRYVCL